MQARGPVWSRLHVPQTRPAALCTNVQPRVDLGGQLSASVAGVKTLLGSRSTAVSTSALGQCSAPRGMTRSSRGLSATLPSRIWIFSSPSRTRKELVGVRVLVPGELTLNLHDPDVVVVIWAIFFGDQCSVRRASITSAFTASMSPS